MALSAPNLLKVFKLVVKFLYELFFPHKEAV